MAASFTRFFAAVLILVSASVSDAQDLQPTLNQQSVNEMLRLFRGARDFQKKLSGSLINPDVFDSFEIENVVFVNLVSDLPSADEAVTDLSKMISVDRAAIHAKPGPEIESLIELMLHRPHEPFLDEVCLSKHGESGFLWKGRGADACDDCDQGLFCRTSRKRAIIAATSISRSIACGHSNLVS